MLAMSSLVNDFNYSQLIAALLQRQEVLSKQAMFVWYNVELLIIINDTFILQIVYHKICIKIGCEICM